MSTVEDVAEVRSWHWRQGSEDEPFCGFDAQDWPCSTARLLDRLERLREANDAHDAMVPATAALRAEVEALRAKVAAVEALTDELDRKADEHFRGAMATTSEGERLLQVACWGARKNSADELRAALATEEPT